MANEKVFKYKIVTQVDAGPIKTLEDSLKRVNTLFNGLSTKMAAIGKVGSSSFEGLGGKLKDIAGTLTKVTLGFAAMGLAAAGAFGKAVVEAGKFRQTAISSLEVFYSGRGEKIFKNLIDIANKTPADTKPLLEFAQSLSGSGFSERELGKLTALRADVESAGGTKSTLDSMASVFSSAAGGAAPELGSDFIQKFLGKNRYIRFQAQAAGIKDYATGNVETLNKQVNDARKSGKLTGTAMVQGLEQAALDRMKSSAIGDMSQKIARGSIAGALSNLSSVFDNMLFSTDLENRPGIKALVRVFTKVSDILLSSSFQEKLGNMIDSVFGAFTKMTDKDIENWLTNIADLLGEAARAAGKVFEWFVKLGQQESLGDALLEVVKGLEVALDYIGTIIGDAIVAAIYGRESKSSKASREKIRKSFENGGLDEKDWVTLKPGMKELDEDENPSWLKPSNALPKSPVGNWVSTQNEGAVNIHNHITVNGHGDAREIGKQAGSMTNAALDKTQAKKNARKAGLSK